MSRFPEEPLTVIRLAIDGSDSLIFIALIWASSGSEHYGNRAEMTDALREWDKRRLEVAQLVAGWSKDPKAKVGAVIADRQGRIVALGYNGFAGGIEDSDERLNNNDMKQETILHAEMNAVLIANRLAEGGTLYVVGKPVCARCASVVIQSGIRRVVGQYPDDPCSKWTATGLLAIQMFEEAKILFDRVEDVLTFASASVAANEPAEQHLFD